MALGIFTHPIGAFAQLDPNDPWPKFARDERNTSHSPYRGPHSTPELRWWAPLGNPAAAHTGGAAITRVDGVRYIIVGTPGNAAGFSQPRVRVYRFHPTATYDPAPQQATPVVDVPLAASEHVRSTPLILPSVVNGTSVEKRMVVQTQVNLRAFNLDALPQAYTPALYARWTNNTVDASDATSPNYGRMAPGDSTSNRIIALAGGRIHVLDPASPGTVATSAQLRASNDDYASPALGPAADEPTRNLVYLPRWSGLGSPDPARPDMHALKFESGAPVVAWQSIINGFYFSPGGDGRYAHGSLGSAGVHADGSVVVGSDDGGLYAFHNRVSPLGNNNERWTVDMGWFVSMTPGIFQPADGDPSVVAWDEGGFVRRFYDHGSSATLAGASHLPESDGANQWDGAPAVDASGRFYTACVNGRVYGFRLRPVAIEGAWESPYTTFVPGISPRSFSAPVAVDEDGTLICVSDGYVLALRPLRGDFNGDGCRNNFDIDPFVLALFQDPSRWEAEYGRPLGLNALGIGDCNNDGVFNNFDIDCFVDLVANHPNCSGGDARGGDDDADAADWAHFWEVIHALRQYYGME